MQADNYATISGYMNDSYTNGYIRGMYALANQGIPIISPINQAQVVKAVLTDSKVSHGLYTALGLDVNRLKKKIASEVSRGIATGMSYGQIARNISNASNAPLSRAKTIARTEGHRIQSQATYDAQFAAKERGADIVKQWDATLDGLTRESHRKVDGEIRELNEKFSNGMEYPGDPSGGAAEVCNCRCALLTRARWALDADELKQLQDRAEFFGLDKSKQFEDFKQKYLDITDKDGIIDIEIDKLTPCLIDKKTGEKVDTTVEEILDRNRLEGFNKTNGWFINWKQVPKDCTICALKVKGNDSIQGLLAYRIEPQNRAAFAHWIVSAPHNRGKGKQYEGVGGHLFAAIAQASYKAGYNGFIYGIASSDEVLKHYVDKLGATPLGGRRFCIDEESAYNLLSIYSFENV